MLVVLTADGGVTGAFDELLLPSLPDDLSFIIRYGADSVELEVVDGFAADFNFDGAVDGQDLAIWQTNYGSDSGADANQDGTVDGQDFLIWQQQNGSTLAGIAGGTAPQVVPEPSTGMLAMALGLSVFSVAPSFKHREKIANSRSVVFRDSV